jgi:transcriptional regulator with XRE-family HTH domain
MLFITGGQMIIGDRLRMLREARKLSQGDVEVRTGLLRCYTSRVENGHTIPSLETLEKYARGLGIPMYQLVYDGEEPPVPPKPGKHRATNSWESSRASVRLMNKLIPLIAKMAKPDRDLILFLAGKVAHKHGKRVQKSFANGDGAVSTDSVVSHRPAPAPLGQ